ncbi:MAG TPA: cytochrome P450 [Albitalea sp.]|nr:cytochrome P450 [Albitalea sp.]
MNHPSSDDWDPEDEAVREDQRAAYDELRERCPVAHSRLRGWSVLRHADVLQVLHDHASFSNVVSAHRAVPNGMDPPEHDAYRRIVEAYFEPAPMAAFEPRCRDIAAQLVRSLPAGELDLVAALADPFAVQVQCAFMGWPDDMREPIRQWTRRNYEARRAADPALTRGIAREFEEHVVALLQARRHAGDRAPDDVTTRLLREQVDGRPLRDDEIVSIVRNWTVGEIATISASIGILAEHLALDAPLQDRLRAQPSLLPPAIDEILRLHGPLVTNRRVTTRPVELGGRTIAAGERISVNWVAANRDPRAFEDAQAFRLDRDPARNLLYGAGIHVCPGAPLARMELRVVMEELLARTRHIEPLAEHRPDRAVYPSSGFSTLMLRLR